MNDREYIRLRTKIEAEYRRKMEALELIRGLSDDKSPSKKIPPMASRGEEVAEKPTDYVDAEGAFGLTEQIRRYLSSINGPFTILDVESAILQFLPSARRHSIGVALMRMRKKGEIDVETKGSGRRPTRYIKGPLGDLL